MVKKYEYKKEVKKRKEPSPQYPYANHRWVLIGYVKDWDEADRWIAIKGNRKQFEYKQVPLDKKGSQISATAMKRMIMKKQNPQEIALYARVK